MSDQQDDRLTELVKAHVDLSKQVAALTRFLLGFIGDDNRLYPGVATRLASLETKMDVAMRVLSRIGAWSVRILCVIMVILLLEFLGVKPTSNIFGMAWRLLVGA